MDFIFRTNTSWSSLILRVTLGVVLFPHGAQKLLGWYGGGGFSGTMGFFTEHMHIPWILAFLVIIIESIGAVALIAGFLTRLTAIGTACIMIGAVYLVHWPFGFFMNWFGKQPGEGIEYHILVFGISLALMAAGGGKWSVDGWIHQRIRS